METLHYLNRAGTYVLRK